MVGDTCVDTYVSTVVAAHCPHTPLFRARVQVGDHRHPSSLLARPRDQSFYDTREQKEGTGAVGTGAVGEKVPKLP